ncbi:ABC transporter substrate-binding protein [Cohnella lupini]|uniref:Carbohydrate ABC transporter substrate-binding protein (CUT1 family) n=1 Tax=Cohnella lupini TaxID=1294267 RepID=A0A3D9IJ36_9BACL|nr:extracellular solute-binding protein [Cohnella lupini]RED61804.1 carbohydrate ABC transporter substrate-binding protein (CUT1 family) [Cohnella lupini]
MLKKKTIAMYMLTLVLFLAACSNGASNEPDKEGAASQATGEATTDDGKEIELRMSWWGADERHEKTLKVIELFEQKNPGVKITGEYSGFDGYLDKLNTQIAAGNAPDLIQLGGNIKEYVDKNALLDLTPYVGDILHVDDFNGGLVKAATFNDKLYGVTLGVSSTTLMYNASMFEKAGLPVPNENWTYDDFKADVIQIAEKLGKGHYGSYDLSSDAASLGSYLGSVGKELYRDGERHFDKQEMIDWFSMWDELRKAGAIVPADVQVASPPTAVDKSLVVKGEVAIQSASASQIFGFQELTQDQLGLTVYPNGPAGSGMIPPISGQFITSYEGTKHPEMVAKFIDFMVNDPEAGVILGSTRGVPPAAKIRDVLAAQSTPVDKVLYDYISLVSNTAPAVDYQQFPLDNEFTKLLQLTSEKIAFNANSIESSVDEFMTETDKLLAKAKAQ